MEKDSKDLLALGKLSFATEAGIEWLSSKGKWVLLFLGAGIGVLFCSYHFLSYKEGAVRSNFQVATSTFQEWLHSNQIDSKQIDEVKHTLRHHPELAAQFGSLVAQKMLLLGDAPFAEKQTRPIFDQIEKECPYYVRFSRNSLEISKERFAEALQEAKSLKSDLQQDVSFWDKQNQGAHFGRYLYAMNLLRIALLEKRAGTLQSEKMAWEEIEQLAQAKKDSPAQKWLSSDTFQLLEDSFRENELSISDYMRYRKKEIASAVDTLAKP